MIKFSTCTGIGNSCSNELHLCYYILHTVMQNSHTCKHSTWNYLSRESREICCFLTLKSLKTALKCSYEHLRASSLSHLLHMFNMLFLNALSCNYNGDIITMVCVASVHCLDLSSSGLISQRRTFRTAFIDEMSCYVDSVQAEVVNGSLCAVTTRLHRTTVVFLL